MDRYIIIIFIITFYSYNVSELRCWTAGGLVWGHLVRYRTTLTRESPWGSGGFQAAAEQISLVPTYLYPWTGTGRLVCRLGGHLARYRTTLTKESPWGSGGFQAAAEQFSLVPTYLYPWVVNKHVRYNVYSIPTNTCFH